MRVYWYGAKGTGRGAEASLDAYPYLFDACPQTASQKLAAQRRRQVVLPVVRHSAVDVGPEEHAQLEVEVEELVASSMFPARPHRGRTAHRTLVLLESTCWDRA